MRKKTIPRIVEEEMINDNSDDNNFEDPEVKNLFADETYYKKDNLERYERYLEQYPELASDEVVKCVNANLDYDFYTNVVDTDLEKKTLVLVNKYHKLASDYVPDLVSMESKYASYQAQMERVTYSYFKKMVDDAAKEGIRLFAVSAYRSYSLQNTFYTNYVKRDGIEASDRYSARPGYSEHQTGLASDINTASSSAHFETTKEYAWLQNNSYKYGFILRYPKDKEYITGYKYEPWHYRYVGEDVAAYIREHNITYEEYYAYFVTIYTPKIP